MSETHNDTPNQKPRISLLAIGSLAFCASGLTMAGLYLIVWTRMEAIAICLALIAFSVTCGIGALLMVASSKKRLIGAKIAALSIGVSVVALFTVLGMAINVQKARSAANHECSYNNLCDLGRAIRMYSSKNYGKYPEPDKWCDLLVKYTDIDPNSFICKSALRRGDTGPSHFAINPNCRPNSPPDTVLLFETKGGWNQFGGVEKMTFGNHESTGANVLYNLERLPFVYSAGFVSPERAPKLTWHGEQEKELNPKGPQGAH